MGNGFYPELPTNAAVRIKRTSEVLRGQWIWIMWDDISAESITSVFKKCCVSNDIIGTDDGVQQEEGEEENSSSSDDSADRD